MRSRSCLLVALLFGLGACSSQGTASDAGPDGQIGSDAGLDAPPPPPADAAPDVASDAATKNGQSLIWVWYDYPGSLASVAANPKSFTHVSPALYQINYAYTSGVAQFTSSNKTDSFDGLTSTQIAQQVHAAGMKCVPLVFGGAGNAGTDQGIHAILDDSPSGTQSAFITSMVNEAVAKGYDGYNLDWEVDTAQTSYASYGAKLETFLAAFKSALHQHGMQLSFDLGTWYLKQSYCSGGTGFVDLTAIGPNVDLAILEAYSSTLGTPSSSCPASIPNPQTCIDDFVSEINLMCVYVPNGNISIGFNANPTTGSNPIAGSVVQTTQAYGIHNVAVWPDYNTDGTNGAYVFLDAKNISPANTTWFALLAGFLAAQ